MCSAWILPPGLQGPRSSGNTVADNKITTGAVLHTHQTIEYQKTQKTSSVGKDVEKLEHSCTAGRNVEWRSLGKLNREQADDPESYFYVFTP
jgi:hypothetical protein